MIVTTGDSVEGRRITKYLGVIISSARWHSSVIARGIDYPGEDCEAEYEAAYRGLREKANAKRADAVIGLRFVFSVRSKLNSYITAYGTAVLLTDLPPIAKTVQ